MTTALTHQFFVVDRGESALSRGLRRAVNAIVAARAAQAEREIRRYLAATGETRRIQGDFMSIGLERSDILPFND